MIDVRFNKPTAVALVKCLFKEGMEKTQEDHQPAVSEHEQAVAC